MTDFGQETLESHEILEFIEDVVKSFAKTVQHEIYNRYTSNRSPKLLLTSDGIGSCFCETEPNRLEKVANRIEPNRPIFLNCQTEPNRTEKICIQTEPNRTEKNSKNSV
jgi:hypothetical protein